MPHSRHISALNVDLETKSKGENHADDQRRRCKPIIDCSFELGPRFGLGSYGCRAILRRIYGFDLKPLLYVDEASSFGRFFSFRGQTNNSRPLLWINMGINSLNVVAQALDRPISLRQTSFDKST